MTTTTFLEACKVKDYCFALGPFFTDGITIFKQQTRALNLAFLIANSGLVANGNSVDKKNVVVIGGGVAGVTIAAGLSLLGNDVTLFEQRPVLCHLQNGCDTRWIHPHNYDWPDLGSDSPYAALPVLSWHAGTASEVAEQIVGEFRNIQTSGDLAGTLNDKLGATTHLDLENKIVSWDNANPPREGGRHRRGGRQAFDVAILATGFGIETGVADGNTDSYWRNDSVNQPKPGVTSEKPQTYFISGTGDGGLIDLLRARISSFYQSWILDDLVDYDSDQPLLNKLRNIKQEWRQAGIDETVLSPSWLFEQFESAKTKGLLNEFESRLCKKIRRDTSAILNGRKKSFSEVLDLKNSSMFNCLATYLLYENGAFTYVFGDCEPGKFSKREISINQQPEHDKRSNILNYFVDRVIVRHGTSRELCFELAGVGKDEIKTLEDKQKLPKTDSGITRLWEAGWPYTSVSLTGRVERKEFNAQFTKGITSTFVSTLSEVLIYEHERLGGSAAEFRIALHRLIEIQGEVFFQQASYYSGQRTDGAPGRIFEADKVGIVGLAARRQNPIVLKRGSHWGEIWAELFSNDSEGVRTAPEQVKSMLAIPICYSDEGEDLTCLILYLDSAIEDFFNDEVLERIFAATKGFVVNMDKLVREKDIKLASNSFKGFKKNPTPKDDELFSKYVGEVIEANSELFEKYKTHLRAQYCLNWDFAAPD